MNLINKIPKKWQTAGKTLGTGYLIFRVITSLSGCGGNLEPGYFEGTFRYWR